MLSHNIYRKKNDPQNISFENFHQQTIKKEEVCYGKGKIDFNFSLFKTGSPVAQSGLELLIILKRTLNF